MRRPALEKVYAGAFKPRAAVVGRCRGLPVYVSSVRDRRNGDGIPGVVKTQAKVAYPQPEFGRLETLQAFYVALTAIREAGECVQDAHGLVLIDCAKFLPGLGLPTNLFLHMKW